MAKSILLVYYSKLMESDWQRASPHTTEQIGGFPAFLSLPAVDRDLLEHWLEQVRIEPIFAKRWRVDPGWGMSPRSLANDWLMWIEQGSIEAGIDDVAPAAIRGGGTLMVVPAGTRHFARLHQGRSGGLVTAHFHAQLFGSLGFLDLMGMAGIYRYADSSPVAAAMWELSREVVLDGPGRKMAMRGLIERILLEVIRNHGGMFRLDAGAGRYPDLARLQPILKLIDEGLDKSSLSVPELADAAAVSEVYLRRIFRRTLGISPAAYMQRGRVQRAGQLLRTTQLSVKEISRQCGFTDPHFLMRVFRKWMNQTPTEFRETRHV